MYSTGENCVFIWKLLINMMILYVHVRVQFDRSFESKAESTAESKAECGAYFTVVLIISECHFFT